MYVKKITLYTYIENRYSKKPVKIPDVTWQISLLGLQTAIMTELHNRQ